MKLKLALLTGLMFTTQYAAGVPDDDNDFLPSLHSAPSVVESRAGANPPEHDEYVREANASGRKVGRISTSSAKYQAAMAPYLPEDAYGEIQAEDSFNPKENSWERLLLESVEAQARSTGDRYAVAMESRAARIAEEEQAATQGLATGGALAGPKSIPLDPTKEDQPKN